MTVNTDYSYAQVLTPGVEYDKYYELQYYEFGDWVYFGSYRTKKDLEDFKEGLEKQGKVTRVCSYMKERKTR